jgi:hypothetical protein
MEHRLMERIYCTIADLIEDLGLPGVPSEAGLMRHIQAASQEIDRIIGAFIPRVETIRLLAEDGADSELLTPPLLSITSIRNHGTLLSGSDYRLQPSGRLWTEGPYAWIERIGGCWATDGDGVEITGELGMYRHAEALGVTITSADTTDTTLTVADGSKCSPGMVLLVDAEQMLVRATGSASDSGATLAADAGADDDEITLSSGAAVQVGEIIKTGFEQMRVLDLQTNLVQVARGWNSTKRAAHSSGAAVNVYRSFNVTRGANGTTAATHSSAAATQLQPPSNVNYLCRQIAALMMKKAQTGFVGRSGNDELGTGFWINEFPANQIEAVRQAYFWGGR